jgi:hypothetical protein
MKEVRGEWRKLYHEEVNALYSSPNIIRVTKTMRRVGNVGRMGEMRGACRVFVGKSEVRRLLERPRHRWENNIKMGI